ncbi:MAG: transposase [Dehalococcoidia bacterium]|jgi:transposase
MKRNRFSKEFKLEALALLKHGDLSGAELARQLGIRRNQLYKWRREVELKGPERAFRGAGRNAAKDSLAETTALKRRVAQLEEENAILKKAAAYFTRQQR